MLHTTSVSFVVNAAGHMMSNDKYFAIGGECITFINLFGMLCNQRPWLSALVLSPYNASDTQHEKLQCMLKKGSAEAPLSGHLIFKRTQSLTQ